MLSKKQIRSEVHLTTHEYTLGMIWEGGSVEIMDCQLTKLLANRKACEISGKGHSV